MATISSNGAKGHHKFTLEVNETGTSTANNTSSLSYTFKISPVQSGWDWSGYGSKISYKITIGSHSYTGTIPSYNGSSTITLSSGSDITETHNSDGTKSITIAFSVTDGVGASYTCGNASSSTTMNLTTIARASQPSVSASSVNLGSSVDINTNRASSNFTHTLTISVGGAVRETFTSIGSSKSWTPSLSTYASLIKGNPPSTTATISCTTYSGSTNIGTKTCTITLVVPNTADTKPTISISSVSEANATMRSLNWGIYVKGKSQLAISLGSSTKYGATIASYSATANGATYTSQSFTTGALSGNGTITATLKDSRGFSPSASATSTYSVVDYVNPSITTATAQRCTSDGTLDDEGTYLKYTFKGSVAPVSNKNAKVYKIGYKKSTESSYTYVTITNDAYTISKENLILSGVTFENTSTYDIIFSIQDSFTTATLTRQLGTGFDLMNFNENGKAMAIGKTSEKNNALEVGLKMSLSKTAEMIINGEAMTDYKNTAKNHQIAVGVGDSGNAGIFDRTKSAWKFHVDTNGNCFINGSQLGSSAYLGYDNHTSLTSLSNSSAWTASTNLMTRNNIAYWNGAYAGTTSNLTYAYQGTIQCKPTTLYSNATGTNGTVTLNQTAANFSRITIYFRCNDNDYNSVEVVAPNGKVVDLTSQTQNATNVWFKIARVTISGTSITKTGYCQFKATNGSACNVSSANNIYIMHVEGFK